MELTGAQILIRCLQEEGVDTIFGYPGGRVLNIYDEIFKSNIGHILTRHEQGAVHAADAYARVTGRPGVCITTSGPGATNAVTGIATAHMDSVPLIVFTGQVGLTSLGRDSFQEADITGITLPITKHSYLVKDTKDLARIIKEAFYIATTGRPGPVVIDVPSDITVNKARFDYPKTVNLRGYRVLKKVNLLQINQAANVINESYRPVLYVGGGAIISGITDEILALAEKVKIPVTTTLMGLGAFPETHRLSLGMLGMHGTHYANYAICECDCLIAVGARFDDRVTGKIETFAPKARVVHIDIDAAEIGKNVRVDVPIVGDARTVLIELLARVNADTGERAEWLDRVEQWKQEYPLHYTQDGENVKPQHVIEQIYEVTRGEAIITTEVGQNQMWAAQYYKFSQPRTMVTSGGLGTMGFGLPAAIGAQIGQPDKIVFGISGDGSFQMNSQEMATAVAYNLPVKVAILNNGYLGMVRQWQQLFYGGRYSQTDLLGVSPDFVKLAEAYGAVGIRVERPEEVRPALEKALSIPGPVLLDFVVDREENVFPMVPPGGSLDDMLGGCMD
ncbi:MAG: biosynthetic-type acetolactate synthase large subunit [Syntrophomonadaceae bacterium]|nr:biosynthetic-type acetolactate synthase large subunit [Syntrophomonadaceae bacterium]